MYRHNQLNNKKQRMILAFLFYINISNANIYIAYYATQNGNTGHIGIAVDNYDIKIRDFYNNNTYSSKEDSVKNGTLSYFDLWPAKAIAKIWQIQNDYEPLYIQYPKSDFDAPFYLEDLFVTGIPKKKKKTLDGLLQINTTAKQDFLLRKAIDSLINTNRKYNAVKYNCTDFVKTILSIHFGKKIKIKREHILYAGFYTPNRLFKKLQKEANIELLIDPKEKTKGHFFRERFLKRIFHKQDYFDEKINSTT